MNKKIQELHFRLDDKLPHFAHGLDSQANWEYRAWRMLKCGECIKSRRCIVTSLSVWFVCHSFWRAGTQQDVSAWGQEPFYPIPLQVSKQPCRTFWQLELIWSAAKFLIILSYLSFICPSFFLLFLVFLLGWRDRKPQRVLLLRAGIMEGWQGNLDGITSAVHPVLYTFIQLPRHCQKHSTPLESGWKHGPASTIKY